MTQLKKQRDYLSPNNYGLPFDGWRSGQTDGMDWIQRDGWFYSDSSQFVKMIEAPTGTGKSGLVLALSSMYPELRFLVLCATKLEQDQYEKNITDKYEGFQSIRGRNNFHCILEDESVTHICEESYCHDVHVDEAKCTIPSKSFECPKKSICPYYGQLNDVWEKRIIVTNYAYGLTMLNHAPDRLGKFDVIVEDEGHVLDQMLEHFIEVRLWRRQMTKLYNIKLPQYETVTEWQHWCNNNSFPIEELFYRTKRSDVQSMSSDEINIARGAKNVKDSFDRIKNLDTDWVVEKDPSSVPIKPVWITSDSHRYLFRHAKRHLIMSGTIPSFIELAKKIGLSQGEYTAKRMPYIFPIENRPIVLNPIANMSARHIDESLPKIKRAIDRIISANMDKKILVHTVNYKIASYLQKNSQHKHHILTHDSKNRIEILNRFKRMAKPSILVSPSFDKAVDLPDDECELIIIAKLPYPYLGSKVMKKRLEESRRYYDTETLSTVIQMAGRGVRKETDICPTVILDSNEPQFFQRCRTQNLIPEWVDNAIQGV